jgi:hypothetical protein
MELLEAFIEFAPEDIYKSLSHLDAHRLASSHATLGNAVDARTKQQRIHEANRLKKLDTFPSAIDQEKARLQVDEARLAVLEEPEMMADLEAAKRDFCQVVKFYTETFARRTPTFEIFRELEDEFTKSGTWYTVFPPIYCPLIQMDVRVMGICVTWSFSPGSIPMVDIRKTNIDRACEMHDTWNESLALAARIVEIIGIPYDISYIADFPESVDLRRCLIHGKLPPYDGSNDDRLNADFFH